MGIYGKKKVFVSFDYEKDRNYYYLMKAWIANDSFEFVFSDYTSREIKSDSVSVVKAALTHKIKEADYTLVLIGEDANRRHPDFLEIGYRNWQNFEVAKSREAHKKLVAVSLNCNYEWPEELRGAEAAWARTFACDAVMRALDKA